MLRRVKDLIFRGSDADSETYSTKQTSRNTQRRDDADASHPSAAEFASALLAKEASFEKPAEEPVYVLDELENGDQNERVASIMSIGNLISDPHTPRSVSSQYLVSSTPLRRPAPESGLKRNTRRKRFKKYDVNSRRRVINPSLELEEEEEEEKKEIERPLQVIEVSEASGYYQEVQSEIFRELEEQLDQAQKETSNGIQEGKEEAEVEEKEDDQEEFFEAHSQFEGQSLLKTKEVSNKDDVELVERQEPEKSKKSQKKAAKGLVKTRRVPTQSTINEESSKESEESSDSEAEGKRETSLRRLRRNREKGPSRALLTLERRRAMTRKTRKLRRDSTGNWTTKEDHESDSDVIEVGEEEAELIKIKIEQKQTLFQLLDDDIEGEISFESANESFKSARNTSQNESGLPRNDSGIQETKSSPIKTLRDRKILDVSKSNKFAQRHSTTSSADRPNESEPKTPRGISNRYPFASALSPGGVVYTPLSALGSYSSTAPSTGWTQVPRSQTSQIKTSQIKEEDEHRRPKSERGRRRPSLFPHQFSDPKEVEDKSEQLFVSPDSPASCQTQEQPPTSPYMQLPSRDRLKRKARPSLSDAASKLDMSYRIPLSSQSEPSMSSQERDKLMVPESSSIEENAEEGGRKVNTQESAVVSSQEKSPVKLPPRKPFVGTLPTVRVMPKTLPTQAKPEPENKVSLNPMYAKISRTIPNPTAQPMSKPQPKSLAQQLKERRERLERSSHQAQET